MSTAIIKPGACGMETKVIVSTKDKGALDINIETNCAHIKKMEEGLKEKELDGITESFAKFSSSSIYQLADKHCRHLACPVPCGIIKAIEVESGMALPKEVEITISKE
ncbi:MAG: hypothetical protein SCK28_06705 [Bacillota bacterium]|nr:hypothetical protein [Bacillota bacterium]